jgi:hypothetical protein
MPVPGLRRRAWRNPDFQLRLALGNAETAQFVVAALWFAAHALPTVNPLARLRYLK